MEGDSGRGVLVISAVSEKIKSKFVQADEKLVCYWSSGVVSCLAPPTSRPGCFLPPLVGSFGLLSHVGLRPSLPFILKRPLAVARDRSYFRS
ncbi:hypothetical protein TNCV_3653951 [Trichonephila clavipes]|nr:hypothetical protein TNCV_3653951 [Trichonephila clavipes]